MPLHHENIPHCDERSHSGRCSDRWIVAGLILLGMLLLAAMAALSQYKSEAGEQGRAPSAWPLQSRIQIRMRQPVLLLFAHPMCSCTRASLAELRVLMSEFDGQVDARVLLALPAGAGTDWVRSETWTAAEGIPGVAVQVDVSEREARRFGAKTSGHVVLYSAQGQLLFAGGITGARGHVGNNEGRARLTAQLRNQVQTILESPVFGCPLEEHDDKDIPA
jgi:hypothetical protein